MPKSDISVEEKADDIYQGVTMCALEWEAHVVLITQTPYLAALNPTTHTD